MTDGEFDPVHYIGLMAQKRFGDALSYLKQNPEASMEGVLEDARSRKISITHTSCERTQAFAIIFLKEAENLICMK